MDKTSRDFDAVFFDDLDRADFKEISDNYDNKYIAIGVHVGWNTYICYGNNSAEEFIKTRVENIKSNCSTSNSILQYILEKTSIMDYIGKSSYFKDKIEKSGLNNLFFNYFEIFEQVKEIEIMNYLRENQIITFLILPGNISKEYPKDKYGMINYIEEFASSSDNFICMESKGSDNGELYPKDIRKLKEFYKILKSGDKSIYATLFGGQVGCCLNTANSQLESIFTTKVKSGSKIAKSPKASSDLVIIPEYTSLWPAEIPQKSEYNKHIIDCFRKFGDYNGNIVENLAVSIEKLPEVNNAVVSEIERVILKSKPEKTKIAGNFLLNNNGI